ncbi:MAG TPA: AbrB/MazE/SpoVT family DNA-binding domain-containing protein [Nitrososphaerales archaeon]|nr:AbrB/MazE/SpoVT family DNA-binding domain-containing protein [Nitrososphaerales archaeon]
MAKEVVVTRRGQTTIPLDVRMRLGIEEGSRLRVDVENGKVVFSKLPSLFDLAGTSQASRKSAFRQLDQIRSEE